MLIVEEICARFVLIELKRLEIMQLTQEL